LKKQPFEISRLLENDLEKVTASYYPVILTIKKALLEAGASGASMSGSGSSVFGVFTDRHRLNDAARVVSSLNLGQVFAVRGL
jgi:4-diphosphocytidyl-2-C-methyl-D-erythritol kinase